MGERESKIMERGGRESKPYFKMESWLKLPFVSSRSKWNLKTEWDWEEREREEEHQESELSQKSRREF